MRSTKRVVAGAAAGVVAGVALVQVCSAAPLTPGNLVLTRAVGGTGSYSTITGQMTTPTALTGGGAAATVVLDEYTTAGVFVQSIVMPNTFVGADGSDTTTTNGVNRGLVFSGTQNQEGAITLSNNGQYLVLTGYNQTAGVASTNNAQSTAVERTIGRVDLNGNINTTTALHDVATGQSVRSAYSTNGTDFWIGGVNGGNVTVDQGAGNITYSSGGVHVTTLGSKFSTQLTANGNGGNFRVMNGFNNQLYISNNVNTATLRGIHTIGTGFPTTGGPTVPVTQLPGFSAVTIPTPSNETADDYWFKDANTLYIADERAGTTGSGVNDGANGGVQKWLFTDTNADTTPDTWVFQYNVPLGTQAGPTLGGNVGGHGLAGMIDGSGNAVLFVTTFDGTAANRTKLITLTDTGTQAGFASSLTVLATSPDNGAFATAFRGVELIPVPEPTGLVAMGVFVLATAARRRRVQ